MFLIAGCVSTGEDYRTTLKTGAQNLIADEYDVLVDRNVGLVTNHSARVGSEHLIDVLNAAPRVNLVALYGPEHGIRGDAAAGASVSDSVDSDTGVPIYSLYGNVNRPSQESLSGVDVLVFDIQDVGARFYTYISTMGRAMQSAAEAGIPFVVLDRPNPLGGDRVDGFVRDSLHVSGVGLYPIPVQHGMTVAELALMIKGEAFLPGLENLDVQVMTMTGWTRNMLWPDTNLEWIPTSPNIPDFETALVYPGTCFFEGTTVSEGRGMDRPFLTIGAPWLNAEAVISRLERAALTGVAFSAGQSVPRTIPGVAENPKFENESIPVVEIEITDTSTYHPLRSGVAMLKAIYDETPIETRTDFFSERWIGLLAGSDELREMIEAGVDTDTIVHSWKDEVDQFLAQRKNYLLYD